ncbi:hypothetical protein GCM10010112_45500 [Actinoplanes lobatus]|uniref:Uncharacterized protein n=1 Tax=Actinoplanes lobatus TaxID=113568 RepID=A0ABQ4ADK2_9ACTN|nr:hypothetical protein GCM10010112_45500 [Actinoplanes lobatus]GIE39077.1 hypothetical protein Alo02nite_19750 [Actinoplanes lobatus]
MRSEFREFGHRPGFRVDPRHQIEPVRQTPPRVPGGQLGFARPRTPGNATNAAASRRPSTFRNCRCSRGRGCDDVVNDTFIILMTKWDTIRLPERYMFTVARRIIAKAAREGGRFTGAPRNLDHGERDPGEADQVEGCDQLPTAWAPAHRTARHQPAARRPADRRTPAESAPGRDAGQRLGATRTNRPAPPWAAKPTAR